MSTHGSARPLTGSDEVFARVKDILVTQGGAGVRAYAMEEYGGVAGLLDLAFDQLPGAFIPERAGARAIGFQFVIEDVAQTHGYFADVRDGQCRTGRGTMEQPSTTLTMTLEDFLGVLVGSLAPARAFLTKKIRVQGEMMSATKFESWFRRP
jgi:hypothetical protein